MADGERVRSAPSGSSKSTVSFPCSCGREAVVEKAGRTVCRLCADKLSGHEYPLRNGRQRCSFGSATEARQMDMLAFGPQRYYGC